MEPMMMMNVLAVPDLDQYAVAHLDSNPAVGEVQDFCHLDHTSCHFLLLDQERVICKRVPVAVNNVENA
jgi:hypothetical protein